jgi:hypothetical protein
VRLGTLASLALAALGIVLFAVKVNYLGEGYEGSWDAIVLVVAWLAIAAALLVAIITTASGAARLRRRS